MLQNAAQITTNATQIDILKGLLLGGFACVANLFLNIPIFGTEHLSWGMGFVLFALITFGQLPAFIALALCLLSLAIGESEWYYIIATVAEFVVISLLLRKSFFIVMAALCFWLFIGSPFLLASAYLFSENGYGQNFELVFAASAGLNGLFNASFAALLYLLTPSSWLNDKNIRLNKKLSSNIFALSALTLILPLVTVSLVLASTASTRNQEQLEKIFKAQSQSISLATEDFINQHFTVVKQLATTLSIVQDQNATKQVLVQAQKNYPDFFNITLIEKDGYTAFFAPERYNEELKKLPERLRYVNDRMYFIHAKTKLEPFVSEALMSRGVIAAPMIAMSSPIIIDGQFSGAILGAMNLSYVKTLHANLQSELQTDSIVITDASKRVIYASAPLQLDNLKQFSPRYTQSSFIADFPMLVLNNTSYPYHTQTNSYGWTVYVIKPSSELVELFSQHILVLWFTVMTVILLFLFIAYKLSKRITSPLVALLDNNSEAYISNFEVAQNATSSKEINDVAAKLKKSHRLLRDFEDQLQQQVHEKTTQLKQMNLQLAAQAREDGLTHLLNRNGFDEIANNAIKTSYRLQQPVSLALIDIDDFKLINDSYGHPVGDKCLRAFSELMQTNCKRETDIIGRYGGEEFVILMAGVDVHAHHQLMHNIRVQTQDMLVEVEELQKPISFTISIGLCSLLGRSQLGLHEVINIADEELYKSKRNGKNQLSIVTIDPE
ncbi:diguanylate cyclase [Glaciecola sp. MH2013]|uniref:sensor domain-containing diguanylate cyclase n=1 Tax=Glaciecola sp. MH2013 TaxID=2785524 RepID=UPI00189DA920|nr:diguanylate cyclase [Glaciecola sp. MH2013]MBF7074982.1 diguanylate cyclase [Glaciecola sp. MH2013]